MDFYELGKELATLRKSKNISQQTLAKDLHISRATISNFETGNSVDIGLKKVLQIIDYLGIAHRYSKALIVHHIVRFAELRCYPPSLINGFSVHIVLKGSRKHNIVYYSGIIYLSLVIVLLNEYAELSILSRERTHEDRLRSGEHQGPVL